MPSNRNLFWILFWALVLLAVPVLVGARPLPVYRLAPPVTIITVDSGTDPDNSKSKGCSTDTPCTLRRAIVEARRLSPAERPVLIAFNIPATAVEGYNSELDAWQIDPMTGTDPSVFPALEGGQITIDATTQPSGRSDGPKIILFGPGTGNKDAFVIGANSTGEDDGNTMRGFALLNFRTHIIVNSNDNLIAENWFGPTPDGTKPFLRNGDAQDGSGDAGVALSAGSTGNEIRENVFLGFDGVASALRGDGNTFSNNLVGTTGAGTVPEKATDPDLICTPSDWLGGGGISIEGSNHVVTDNVFAALRQLTFTITNQPDALRLSGSGHTIARNQIGVDVAGTDVGVCGRGILLSDSPRQVTVAENVIVNPGLSAISLNGPLYDANELRGNVVRQRADWAAVEGSPTPENAIQLNPSLPEALQQFAPAQVESINGVLISGSSGAGSPCPNCTIELFLDDTDATVEALQSLGVTSADEQGNWQVAIPRDLAAGEGLRTTSTSRGPNTIPGLSANTTTGLSSLFVDVDVRPPYYLPVMFGH